MTRFAVAYVPTGGSLTLPANVELVTTIERGLPAALEWISAGEADTLALAQLGDAARSLGELARLLDWLAEADAALVASDVELDSATTAGRRAIALVREVESWGRHPRDPSRPRGRPGLWAMAPDLVQRIALLRETGLSLHEIADRLNAEGVPTPRGGARWRASSVQAALGYRRPRPPVPGAPRPPKPGAPKPAGPRERSGPPKPESRKPHVPRKPADPPEPPEPRRRP